MIEMRRGGYDFAVGTVSGRKRVCFRADLQMPRIDTRYRHVRKLLAAQDRFLADIHKMILITPFKDLFIVTVDKHLRHQMIEEITDPGRFRTDIFGQRRQITVDIPLCRPLFRQQR